MKRIVLGLLLSMPLVAGAQEVKPLDLAQVPREGKAPKDFVPSGWSIEQTIRGDLDKNGSEDVVLQLIEQGPKDKDGAEPDRARALLALLTEGGKLRRAGASNRILYCSTCAGTMSGEEGGQVKLQKGVIVVDQVSGSRDTTHTTLRFRYEPKDKRFVFIGEDIDMRDRLTGKTEKVSTNLLTGLKISETLEYDEQKEDDVVVSSKKEKVPVKRVYLEDVDISKY
jgi:hypothetical protein